MNAKIKNMLLAALFAALTALFSQIRVPLPFTPVEINLATAAVFLAGGLLGAKTGALSLAVYLALGAVGLPVFSGFSGGLHALAGPTGGFLWGYLAAAFLTGLLARRDSRYLRVAAAMLCGLAACYLMGTLWFMHDANAALPAALIACVLPFLPGDLIKIALCAALCIRLRPALENGNN